MHHTTNFDMQRSTSHSSSFRTDIQALRAFAVIAVLLFHVEFFATPAGFLGVDIFFVISGFVITKQIVREVNAGVFSFTEFYIRRARRIFPASIITVLLTVLAGAAILPANEFQSLGRSALHSLLAMANVSFWMESGYFDRASTMKPLLHMWSLSVEEQFYLVWPLFMVLAARFKIPARVLLIAIAGIVSLAAAEYVVGADPASAFYLPWFRVFQFAAGAGLVFLPSLPDRWATPGYLVGIAAMLVSVCIFDANTAMPGLYSLLPTFGAAAAIYCGRSALAQRASIRPVVFIGNISYSLYLAHWPLIAFYRSYFSPWQFGPIDQIVLILGSLVLGYALYISVERPLRLSKVWRRNLTVGAAVGFSASLYLSASVWATNGWDWRIPIEIRSAATSGPTLRAERAATIEKWSKNAWPVKGSINALVIGDSHAEDIQNGIEQYGAAHTHILDVPYKCQPAFGPRPIEIGIPVYVVANEAESQKCQSDFQAVLDSPLLRQATVVILAARWKPWAVDRIDETINALKARISVPLILVGPTVEYSVDVPTILLNFGRINGVDHYAVRFSDVSRRKLDDVLRDKAKALGVAYFDRFSAFCDGDMCPIIDPYTKDLVSFDYGHMTNAGAKLLVRLWKEREPDVYAVLRSQ